MVTIRLDAPSAVGADGEEIGPCIVELQGGGWRVAYRSADGRWYAYDGDEVHPVRAGILPV